MTPQTNETIDGALEIERACLAAVLQRPDLLVDWEGVVIPEMFSGPRRDVYNAMRDLYRSGEGVDIITVSSALRRAGNQGQILSALADLQMHPIVATHATTYANRLRAQSQLERTKRCLSEGLGKASSIDPQSPQEVSDWLEGVSDEIEASRVSELQKKQGQDLASGLAAALQAITEGDAPYTSTGYWDLDRLLSGGLRPGRLVVVAGRPGMGKSAFALSMALNLATRSCKPDGSKARSALFTLEMCQQEIYERILSSQAQVDLDVIVRRKPNPDERVKLDQACADLRDAPLNVIDNSMATVASIRAYIRKSIMDGNRLDVVFVDYLQLLSSIGRSESRNLEVAAFSRELKAIALEYDITVVALAQLSRSVESRTIGDRPCLPKLSDLRDSGSIEQDADIVMFLYRQSYYDPETNPADKNRCSIIVAKNRSGETGEMALLFRGEQVRFDNACLDPVSVETIRL